MYFTQLSLAKSAATGSEAVGDAQVVLDALVRPTCYTSNQLIYVSGLAGQLADKAKGALSGSGGGGGAVRPPATSIRFAAMPLFCVLPQTRFVATGCRAPLQSCRGWLWCVCPIC